MDMNEKDIILRVEGLKVYFYTASGVNKAVDGVSFTLKKGSTMGIVGESGSGKSVTSSSVMRLMQAKSSYTVSEFKKVMSGIFTTSVNAQTLDECPMAYKGMEDIVENIGDTAEIVKIIKPIYNFKAGEE